MSLNHTACTDVVLCELCEGSTELSVLEVAHCSKVHPSAHRSRHCVYLFLLSLVTAKL